MHHNFLNPLELPDATLVMKALNLILKDDQKLFWINIFGGIVRCDRVAAGVIGKHYKIIGNIPV